MTRYRCLLLSLKEDPLLPNRPSPCLVSKPVSSSMSGLAVGQWWAGSLPFQGRVSTPKRADIPLGCYTKHLLTLHVLALPPCRSQCTGTVACVVPCQSRTEAVLPSPAFVLSAGAEEDSISSGSAVPFHWLGLSCGLEPGEVTWGSVAWGDQVRLCVLAGNLRRRLAGWRRRRQQLWPAPLLFLAALLPSSTPSVPTE